MTTPVIPDEAVEAAVSGIKHVAAMADSGASDEACREAVRLTLRAAAPLILAANAPRVIRTAADIRALGEAVRDGDPDCAEGIPMVVLMEDRGDQPPVRWTVSGVRTYLDENPEVWMLPPRDEDLSGWLTSRVTNERIATPHQHGPWTVVWSRGVELP